MHVKCPKCQTVISDGETDRLWKLREVEKALSKVFVRLPSRNTLIGWIENGTLHGKKIGRGKNYYVFQSSLERFIGRNQLERHSTTPARLAA